MSAEQAAPGNAAPGNVVRPPAGKRPRTSRRLIGIDAARGLALIGLMAIHLFPDAVESTGEPTLAWTLFSGDSAALFALLAGLGLALSSGGSAPHRGRRMTGDRVGLVVRAVLIGAVGLVISEVSPVDPPAYGILLYYAVFFLLAVPFLHLGPRALLLSAAAFGVITPLLMQRLGPGLPGSSAYNHTVENLVLEPDGVAAELLLTGSYPALAYLTYVVVGLGLGRTDLRSRRVHAVLAGLGAALAGVANLVSFLLLRVAGGYAALLESPGMTEDGLDEALTYGPDTLPDTSAWWLALATPHTNTTLAIASSLGTAMAVLGVILLVAPRMTRWLAPLAAMGSMTLTLYSVHLLVLALELHDDAPALWFLLQLGGAVLFAGIWHRTIGRGPLETVVSRAATGVRKLVVGRSAEPPGGRLLRDSASRRPARPRSARG